MDKALEKFVERNSVRKDLWAQYDPEDHLKVALEKVRRVQIILEDDAPNFDIAIDDAIDVINYIAFVIRRLTGEVPHA